MKHKVVWMLGAAALLGVGYAIHSRRKAEDNVRIVPEKAKALLNSGKAMRLIDVRDRQEFLKEHIKGAECVPLEELRKNANEVLPDKESLVLLCCRNGRKSAQAAQMLSNMGYIHVFDLGGILSWPYGLEKETETAEQA